MRRVVVTGLGIISSIGNNKEEVTQALRDGRSGISFAPDYAELGFRSQVHGDIKIDLDANIDRKLKRFMGGASAYSYLAMQQAVADAGLGDEHIANPRTGLVIGSGGGSPENIVLAVDLLRKKGVRRVGPYMATRSMSSTTAACVGTAFKIKGVSYSISSACSTSAHCIGNGAELIMLDKQDIVFAGGGEEVHWTMSVLFDAMGAMSSSYNDKPEVASRAYDAGRDGFVISGGGSVLVLEELEHARARGAHIYAELTGYGASSDGYDMVQPSGEGAVRCMRQAIAGLNKNGLNKKVQYVNTHGTSTPVGDIVELQALADTFASDMPLISSTKSLTGHALGAAGANEAIYSLLMLEQDFVCASANIETLDPKAEGFPIVRQYKPNAGLDTVMSNSFGFGGVNAALVFSKLTD